MGLLVAAVTAVTVFCCWSFLFLFAVIAVTTVDLLVGCYCC